MSIHPLQIEIYERLRTHPHGLKYSEMCPKGVDSDVYNYHVKRLVLLGHIDKNDKLYSLSALGKGFIVDLAPLKYGEPQQMKVAVMCMALRETKDGTLDVLYQKRLRAPHIGTVVMVAGGIYKGELMLAAARRRLLQEAGLDSSPQWLGTLRRIRQNTSGRTWSDITYHVCISYGVVGKATTNKYGEHMWVGLLEAAKYENSHVVGSPFLAALLEEMLNNPKVTSKHFYHEETVVHEIS